MGPPCFYGPGREHCYTRPGGRNARALSLELSRAVLGDARSTQIYVRVSSGCEQRWLFWLSGWPKHLAKLYLPPVARETLAMPSVAREKPC